MAAYIDDANVIGLLESRMEERFEQSWLNQIAFYNPNSRSADEKYALFSGYPKMREWIGARQAISPNSKTYTIPNRKFEATLVVPTQYLRRDQSRLLQAYVGNWAEGVPLNHWEDLVTDLLVANGNAYDGVPFISTAHVGMGGTTTQSNSVTVTEVPSLNVADPTAPTAIEMSNVLMGLAAYLLTITDDQGRDINGSARSFVAIANTIPQYTALVQAINGGTFAGGVDNPLKGLLNGGFSFTAKFLPRWTGTNKVRVLRADGDLKPIMLQQETDMEYNVLARGSDFYFENDAYKYGLHCNRGVGYGLWEKAVEGTLS